MEVTALQYDFYVLKKLNDELWVAISVYTLPVLFVLYIVKLLMPVDNSGVKLYKDVPRKWHDFIVAPCIAYAPIYYVIDGICLIMTGLTAQSQCRTDMLYHHIVSAIFLPMVIYSRHLPSWQIGPAVLHAMLLTFPTQKWLNYPYLAIMIVFHVKLFSQPYTKFLHYKLLKYGVSVLYACLILLWLHSCNNKVEDFPSLVTKVFPVEGYTQFFEYPRQQQASNNIEFEMKEVQ